MFSRNYFSKTLDNVHIPWYNIIVKQSRTISVLTVIVLYAG